MDLRRWIKKARTHGKLTQDALGEALSRTKSNISSWESGQHEPSWSQILQIAARTGYPLSALRAELDLPLTPELVERLSQVDEHQRRRAENAARALLDMPALPPPATVETPLQPANPISDTAIRGSNVIHHRPSPGRVARGISPGRLSDIAAEAAMVAAGQQPHRPHASAKSKKK